MMQKDINFFYCFIEEPISKPFFFNFFFKDSNYENQNPFSLQFLFTKIEIVCSNLPK